MGQRRYSKRVHALGLVNEWKERIKNWRKEAGSGQLGEGRNKKKEKEMVERQMSVCHVRKREKKKEKEEGRERNKCILVKSLLWDVNKV